MSNLHLNLCFKAYKCGLFTYISKKCGTAMFCLVFCRKKGEKLDLTIFHTACMTYLTGRTGSAQPHRRFQNRGT